jgi:hypothetical protein
VDGVYLGSQIAAGTGHHGADIVEYTFSHLYFGTRLPGLPEGVCFLLKSSDSGRSSMLRFHFPGIEKILING